MKKLAALLRSIPNPFAWLADKLDPPASTQRDGGAGEEQ